MTKSSTRFSISLFGTIKAALGERPLTTFGSNKAQALLIYLLLEGQKQHAREALMTMLWQDATLKAAQINLRQTIARLRKAIPESGGHPLLLSERTTVSLNPEAKYEVDVLTFTDLLSGQPTIDQMEEAAVLYRGDFLADFYLPDSNEFEEWALRQRSLYRGKTQQLLQDLTKQYMEKRAFDMAEKAVRRQLKLDNLQESAHRQLMEILVLNGHRQKALAQYDVLCQLLQNELGLEPEPETEILLANIRDGHLVRDVLSRREAISKSNLPQLLTSFIGREREITAVVDLIRQNRLVMLTGVGGIGKTTLSIQVGHQLVEMFPDGVWLVELAPVLDPNLLSQTVATILGLRESASQSVLDLLLNYLRERECLIILDNCEHLIESAAQFVHTLLQGCPQIKILASSRESLYIPAETPFYVPPLSLPQENHLTDLNQWHEAEATQLFVARAKTVLPEFQVTADNILAINQICRQLDGIPLALELAAVRTKLLPTEQIAFRLDRRFHLLTSGNRSALPRHQTLRAMVDWSWELLVPNEQALWRRLSIFSGGATLEAIESVCAGKGVEADEILDLVTQLVNKSLLMTERKQGQETRYYLLETMRQYGQIRLAETDETAKFGQQHLNYFYQLSTQARIELHKLDQMAWVHRLKREINNIRSALKWASRSDPEMGLKIAINLEKFWRRDGYIVEGENWVAQLLTHNKQINKVTEAYAILLQAQLNGQSFDKNKTLLLAKKGLSLFEELGEQNGIAAALLFLGKITLGSFSYVEGYKIVLESLKIYESLDDKLGIATVLARLGREDGLAFNNYAQAKIRLEKSRSLYQELGHLDGVADTFLELGRVAIMEEDYASAPPLLEEALAIWDSFGAARACEGLDLLGQLYYGLGDYKQACDYLERCYAMYQQAGNKVSSVWVFVRLGYVYLHLGEIGQARDTFVESLKMFDRVNVLYGVNYTLEGLASLAVRREQPERAVKLFAWTDASRQSISDPRPENEQTEVDRDIVLIKDIIDEDEFASAYREGEAMTREQVVAYALEHEGLEA